MKTVKLILISAAILTSAACNAEKGNSAAAGPEVTAAAVPAPNNGDWSTIVTKTPEGGFLMGNPDAKVKLVEFASLTCPHCAEFEESGGKALVENYVKKGLVSWELRNFVRDAVDMSATLLSRCGGEASFFGLTRNLFTDQNEWLNKLQSADPARAQALEAMAPAQRFSGIADLAGLKQYAAMRGVPRAKAEQCLANQEEVNRLVQMNTDAASTYNIPGTPSFLINGTLVENVANWELLEPKIKEALAS